MIRHQSLAFKLILLLSGCCSAILLGIFSFNYAFSKKMIMQNVEQSAQNLTLRAVNRIASVVLPVQKVPETMARILENSTMDNKQVLTVLREITVQNKDIYGVCIAYEPYAYKKDQLYYAPYYYKVKGQLKFNNTPGYFLNDFYQIPKEINAPCWSEPYVDDSTNDMMTTYSVPFYRNEHGQRKFKGIVSADISLEELQIIVSSVKVLKTGDAYLISRNGTIITHRNKNLIMNETIFSVAEARGDLALRAIARKMVRGESGFAPFTSIERHKKSWMYYAPIPSTGWTLAVIFPQDEFMADISRLDRIDAVLGIAGLALLIFVIVIIAHSITRPLRGMAKAAEAIGAGNLDAELPVATSEDEVGKLTRSFENMKSSLKKYIQELKTATAAKERIESELKIAHEIQSSMLPRLFPAFPHRKEFDLFAVMEPAKEVGGDFYDFFLVEENKLFFLIGDVSGKGVPAALFMMITKTLMKNEALQHLPPDQVLFKVNNIIALDNDSSMFATIFCGVLDTETGSIECSNAGHNPPVLCRKDQPNEFLSLNHGFVLGPMPNSKYSLQKVQLNPGDTLFMYTDGVTEAMNPAKELFSEQRLQQILFGLHDKSVEETVHAVRNEISVFANGEPQSDDITMLPLKYTGK